MDGDLDTTIVVYMGGCCGDLVTALLDHTNVGLNISARTIKLTEDRQRLKKPYKFVDDREKDSYLKTISCSYKSVPSHDIDYHVSRQHSFIGITVTDPSTALWAATRFRDAHRPEVWHNITQTCGIQHVEEYAQLLLDYSSMLSSRTDFLVDVKTIRQGALLPQLELLMARNVGHKAHNCYRNWLDMQSGMILV